MASSTLGAIYALLTAITWAVGLVLFKRSGDEIPPAALNYLKNSIGLSLMALTLVFTPGMLTLSAPMEDLILLLVSGAVGIAVADTLLFRSLNLLGAGRSAIVACLYSPLIVLFSYLLLGEHLTQWLAVGAVLVLASVLLVAWDRPAVRLSWRQLAEGIFLGAVAEGLMGLAIVAVKPLLEVYPVLWTTTVRMLGGVVGLTLVVLVSRRIRHQVARAFRPSAVWAFALPGAVIGTYVAPLLWVAGFKYTYAMTASILNQTSTLWMVLLAAAFLHERITWAKVVAIALGGLGSVLVLL